MITEKEFLELDAERDLLINRHREINKKIKEYEENQIKNELKKYIGKCYKITNKRLLSDSVRYIFIFACESTSLRNISIHSFDKFKYFSIKEEICLTIEKIEKTKDKTIEDYDDIFKEITFDEWLSVKEKAFNYYNKLIDNTKKLI